MDIEENLKAIERAIQQQAQTDLRIYVTRHNAPKDTLFMFVGGVRFRIPIPTEREYKAVDEGISRAIHDVHPFLYNKRFNELVQRLQNALDLCSDLQGKNEKLKQQSKDDVRAAVLKALRKQRNKYRECIIRFIEDGRTMLGV